MVEKKIKKSKKVKSNTAAELFEKEAQKDEEREKKAEKIVKKKRKREEGNNLDTGKAVQISKEKVVKVDEGNKKNKTMKKKRKNKEKDVYLIGKSDPFATEDEDALDEPRAEKGNKKNKPKNKKRKNEINANMVGSSSPLVTVDENEEQMMKGAGQIKKKKLKKQRRKNVAKNSSLVGKSNPLVTEDEDGLDEPNDDGAADKGMDKALEDAHNFKGKSGGLVKTETRNRKTKKSKKNKKEQDTLKEGENLVRKSEEAVEDDVYCISSGDEDCSKGMKKWLTEYHQSRPGLQVLQQRIDEFIIAHEEKLEREQKEREARTAEEGWTVVLHHRGRKKTTDSETGITVGSVAPAVAENQLTKKKQKEVGVNFYRFQKRDAQRNEILALQSKFEQDRKRIQQLRAARKFKPY